jgi:preprotein translocase subunit SecG
MESIFLYSTTFICMIILIVAIAITIAWLMQETEWFND